MLNRQVHGSLEARRIGDSLPRDIERHAMVDGGANKGET